MADELRKVLYEALDALMGENENVVVLGADLDKPDGVYSLKEKYPDRCYRVGIAEQNMAGIAAGLASQGFIPFINTFCAFATRRICDQVAVSICYAGNNVKIIGTDPGVTAEYNGGTHMAFEDIGVMRSIPNIRIVEPSDGVELAQMIPSIAAIDGPVYLRMYRKKVGDLHDRSYTYKFGKADRVREGDDITIIASGIMLCEALRAADELEAEGVSAEVINLHTIKPIDRETIVASARKTGVIVTAENHNILGGLRSAVAEVITEEYPVRILPVGVSDIKGEVGLLPYLRERFGLDAKTIVETVRSTR
ncbi:MAG: transketolase family protein [Clostridiales Family XIII bacterium]|jgi:transketolase|nr:transketolase family protein [Clostridiales Family XIII bacterium]